MYLYDCVDSMADEETLLEIQVKSLFGHEYQVKIDPSKNIYDLKNVVSKLCLNDPQDMRFIYCGTEMKNSRTIESYNIQKSSCVHLVILNRPLKLHIQSIDGKSLLLSVDKKITLRGLKQEIVSELNVPIEKISLIFCGEIMSDDNKPVVDYNVESETRIHLVIEESKRDEVEKLLDNMEKIIQKLVNENESLRKEVKLLRIAQGEE